MAPNGAQRLRRGSIGQRRDPRRGRRALIGAYRSAPDNPPLARSSAR